MCFPTLFVIVMMWADVIMVSVCNVALCERGALLLGFTHCIVLRGDLCWSRLWRQNSCFCLSVSEHMHMCA